jgi:hypothetical protein
VISGSQSGGYEDFYLLGIQDVAGGKAKILGGYIIGHSKQYIYLYMFMCPIPNGFRDRDISLYSCKIVDKKEILFLFLIKGKKGKAIPEPGHGGP